jgi:hypothetical protein
MTEAIEARDAGEERGGRASRLAAIVFDRNEEPDPPLIAFLEAAARRGARIAGLVQERTCGGGPCALHDARVRNLVTGETLDIMQDLGRDATGCRVDPVAIAVAAGWLGAASAARPDLLVVNRFGRLESEGAGMLAEIGDAFAGCLPLIVCVPKRYLGAWDAFASGLDVKLAPTRESIEGWWTALASPPSGRAVTA